MSVNKIQIKRNIII